MMTLKYNNRALHRIILGVSVLLLSASHSYADTANAPERTLSLSATAVVKIQPDSVFINTGLTTLSKTAGDALRENNVAMTRIIEALKQSGLKQEHIQTTNFSVGPHYSRTRNSGNKSVITGFQVSNSVRIEVKNIRTLGEILDKVVGLGANRINSISFNVKETQERKDKARQKAMDKVKRKAAFYAKNMGVSLGKVLSISESASYKRPSPYMRSFAADSVRGMSVPIAAGEGSISAAIHVIWAIK